MSENGPSTPAESANSRHAGDGGSADASELLFHRDALSLAEQSAGIGVWTIDLAAGTVRGTAQFFRIMGLPPASGEVPVHELRALRHPDDGARVLAGFRDVLEGGKDAYEMEYRIVRPDGQVRWIFGRGRVVRDEGGKPVRYSGIDIDITDRKAAAAELAAAKEALEQLNQALEARVRERTAALEAEAERRAQAEARLHQAQKMEAVGQLTGGLAHDYNNILQVIVGNLEIAARIVDRYDLDPAAGGLRERFTNAIATARRASQSARDLVQRMLAFSRLQSLEAVPLDVNALVDDMRDMIERTLGETIDVDLRMQDALWPTFADRNQLETALLNLVVNARDAMSEGGRLVIETANAPLPAGNAEHVPAGDYVLLRVEDSGCGIPPELLDKVFEPFFTTKDTGRGSGLGLSMVDGFVAQSGGYVRIASRVDEGTTVRVYLPRHREAADTALSGDVPPADAADESMPRAKPGETVLLVEDNDDVRSYVVGALDQLGYAVKEARDGPSALRLLDAHGHARFDLLFTDIVLPGGMSGVDLAAAMRARGHTLPTLYTSGYASSRAIGPDGLGRDALVLAKPYRIEALAGAVRRTIDAASEARAARGIAEAARGSPGSPVSTRPA